MDSRRGFQHYILPHVPQDQQKKRNLLIRVNVDALAFKSISMENNIFLIESFLEEEIKEAIWSCDRNKLPRPDSFNLNFFKGM